MASPDCDAVLSPEQKKNSVTPISSKIAELSESRAELLENIQHLKQDLQNWRSRLDTQVKIYKDEFQDLRTTLKQQEQQDDVAASFKSLRLQDANGDAEQVEDEKSEVIGDHPEAPITKVLSDS